MSHLCPWGDGFAGVSATGIFLFEEKGKLLRSFYSTVPKHSYEASSKMPDTTIHGNGDASGNVRNLVMILNEKNRFRVIDMEE